LLVMQPGVNAARSVLVNTDAAIVSALCSA
jgi:hypothetical protein